ncbi:MAG: hypothetical protein JWO89_2875, partial [Verrucomicrobiaceae bacterium]|nr:hypothetical protein [Verrucomicrobiaceae bacterium]
MRFPFRLFLPVILLVAPSAHAEKEPPAVMNEKHRALLQTYCVGCHGAEKQKGKFRMDELSY